VYGAICDRDTGYPYQFRSRALATNLQCRPMLGEMTEPSAFSRSSRQLLFKPADLKSTASHYCESWNMSASGNKTPRVLVLTATGYFPPFIEQSGQLHQAGKAPRVWLLELPVDLTLLDQRFLTNPPKWLRLFYRAVPMPIAQAIEAFRVRREFDLVFSWGAESVAMPFALLLKMTRTRLPFVALFGWVSPAKKAWLLRLVNSHITKIIIPPSAQRDFAINKLGIPKDKIVDIPWCVDESFWQPRSRPTLDMICSVGREMRDFRTLIDSLNGIDISCHIAGALVRGKHDRWRRTLGDSGDAIILPDNITMGRKSPLELRELYARSRFVVLPLLESDTDNGITCMLEAWSMSRAVICSKVDGQRDVIDHGRNALFVPVGDVEALREAIIHLWSHPDEAARLGQEGRRTVEEYYSLDRFIREICNVIRETISLAT
jgi:glycosyltransferase involved in cell wall biosynthesis